MKLLNKSMMRMAVAALAFAIAAPAMQAKNDNVVPAADLNEYEQQIVGKWENKESENVEGVQFNTKITTEYKADRSLSSKNTLKATFNFPDANNMIFVVADVNYDGTWKVDGNKLIETPNCETIKTSLSVKPKDDDDMISTLVYNIEQIFEQQMIPQMVESICAETKGMEIESIVLKTMVLKGTTPEGEPFTVTVKRVK